MQYTLNHQDRLKALALADPLAPFATPPTGAYLERLVDEGTRWDKPIYLGDDG